MSSRKEQKHQARARRLEQEARLRKAGKRRRGLVGVSTSVAAATAAGIALVVAANGTAGSPSPASPPLPNLAPLTSLGTLRSPGPLGTVGAEGVPVPNARDLAGTAPATRNSGVDGIRCVAGEQLALHIHAHLTVYVNGRPSRIPYGIGISGASATITPLGPYVASGNCFYWLHTHAADGIIHIESPVVRTFTLGDFFDVWGQKLGPAEVGPNIGPVTALYNGRVYRGNPRDIPLTAHAQIQLELGRPLVTPAEITFPAGL